MEGLEASRRLEFHGVAYVLTVCVLNNKLHVQVEEDDCNSNIDQLAWWTAELTSTYVEELTRKTGNFKRFTVFVNMLLRAADRQSDSVFIDLLTPADLELYRKRKLGRAIEPTSETKENGKRYLILTYAVEFDRVHYPLPLHKVTEPDTNILLRTVRRLRKTAIEQSKQKDVTIGKNQMDAQDFSSENQELKMQVEKLTKDLKGHDPSILRHLREELEASMDENKELIGIYQQLKINTSNEIASLKEEIRVMRNKPTPADEPVDHSQLEKFWEQKLADERQKHQHKLQEIASTIQDSAQELQSLKDSNTLLQQKNQRLVRQLNLIKGQNPNNNGNPKLPPKGNTRDSSNASSTIMPKQSKQRRPRAPRPKRPTSNQYQSSDSESDASKGTLKRVPAASNRFKRFDPTAYQQQRAEKLQQLKQKNRGKPRSRSLSLGGYSSDSSACSSTASNKSTGTRGRKRWSKETIRRQRDNVNRLASPKRAPSPGRQSDSETDREDTSMRKAQSNQVPRRPHVPPARAKRIEACRNQVNNQQEVKASVNASERRKSWQLDLKHERPQNDTSLDSFSDIDERLNALQNFLRQAKQTTGPTKET